MTDDTDIEAERVAAMFRQLPLAAVVTVVNAALMTVVLRGSGFGNRPLVWLAATLLVTALRLGVWQAWRRRGPAADRAAFWGHAGTCGAACAGLLWGGGAAWLWPESEEFQLFWVFLVGGMCVGAAAVHFAHFPSALAFILTAALPLAVRFGLAGTERGFAAAAMILVFLAALTVISCRSSAYFGSNVRLRLDLARQAQSLDAANSSLRTEIANHRATEASLRHAQKMEALGQLTGGIAHDFNNLLTVVQGSLMLLRKRLPPQDERAVRLLENALQGAHRGAALTQRLLAFGRRQALRPEAVRLPVLVDGMATLLRGSLGARISLETRFPPDLPAVYADANQLELALLNLVVNARDAMPSGGTVTIGASARVVGPGEAGELPPGAYVVLGVADTGEGMDAATLAQATEPFFTTKGVGKGTGLGLSMVHGLAAQSGGRFVLHSQPGTGTVAELWLPQAELAASPAPSQTAPVRAPVLREGIVLLVDDDPLVLASTAEMLRDLGQRVLEAGSGAAALTMLHDGAAVDLVITDYAMPGMTGLQLAAELHRLQPELPVLLATGYAELEDAEASMVRLTKPFAQEALAQAIVVCLDRHRAARRPVAVPPAGAGA